MPRSILTFTLAAAIFPLLMLAFCAQPALAADPPQAKASRASSPAFNALFSVPAGTGENDLRLNIIDGEIPYGYLQGPSAFLSLPFLL